MNNLSESVRRLAAPPTWSASFTPMIFGFTCAFTFGGEKLTYGKIAWMLLAFFAIALVETGKHALNEILDYQTGDDLVLEEDHLTAFSGGKKVMRNGLATTRQLWGIAAVTLGIACGIGILIAFCLNKAILLIGVIGMLMAVLYNSPQTRLIYYGWGEPCIFIAYGPVCTMGAYHMFAEEFSWLPFLGSLALGFLIVNVLIMNEYPDYEADLASGKRNWLVRLGKEKGVRLYEGLYLLHYVPPAALAVLTKSPLWLLTLLNHPVFLGVIRNIRANKDSVPALTPSCADTITLHARCGFYLDVATMMLFLMG